MSTNENHSEDMFRSSLENYREMPSDRVWAGVESALDNNKKKRRFIIWFWTGGIAFSAVALILGILFLNMPKENPEQFSASNPAKTESNLAKPEKTTADIPNNNQASTAPISVEQSNSSNEKITPKNIPNGLSSTHKKQVAKTLEQPTNVIYDEIIKENKSSDLSQADVENGIVMDHPSEDPKLAELPARNIDVDLSPTLTLPMREAISPKVLMSVSLITPIVNVQGYTGGVGYHRQAKETSTSNVTNDTYNTITTKAKPLGFYSGVSLKAGFSFRNQLYFTAGVGYEMQRFASREKFFIPGTSLPIVGGPLTEGPGFDFLTAFGNANLPLATEDFQPNGETLEGKLVYQNHSLFFPIDIGYKFSYKRLGINLGAVAAFHVPISQSAKFYADAGDIRDVKVNKTAPFNFSVGFQPVVEYRVASVASIMAGGTFRYSVLNAFQNTNNFSRPYVLAGNLGLRFYILKK